MPDWHRGDPVQYRNANASDIMRSQIAASFGVPPHMLGLGRPDESDPVAMAAVEVERICDHVHRAPRWPTVPPELRVWRPFGTGDMCLMVESSEVLVEPARGHGQVSGPITVRRFHVDIERDTAATWLPDSIYATTSMIRPVLRINMHVTAHSPWESRQVTVSHRDALLGLALGVVRHHVPVIDPDDPAGRAYSRPVAIRWARQVAEVARFLPAEESPNGDPYMFAEHVGREHRTMRTEEYRRLLDMGVIHDATRERDLAEMAGRAQRQAERATAHARDPEMIRARIAEALAEVDGATAGRHAEPHGMRWQPPDAETVKAERAERPGADLSWLDAALAENGSDQDG